MPLGSQRGEGDAGAVDADAVDLEEIGNLLECEPAAEGRGGRVEGLEQDGVAVLETSEVECWCQLKITLLVRWLDGCRCARRRLDDLDTAPGKEVLELLEDDVLLDGELILLQESLVCQLSGVELGAGRGVGTNRVEAECWRNCNIALVGREG